MQGRSDAAHSAQHRIWTFVALVCVGAGLILTSQVCAGGGPHNVLIIINPNNDESLYVGNYYKNARNIPDRNVVYFDPQAGDYTEFVGFHLDALLGSLATRAIEDHIDYVIVTPGANYRVPASGLISDICVSVNNFAVASTYTMAHVVDDILAGDTSQKRNEYFGSNNTAIAFDSNTSWRFGLPSTSTEAHRYFIGSMLGYTGARGNTIEEITTMIDRSVAADGSRPDGTFYYVQTTDNDRSPPRDPFFTPAVAAITPLGFGAEHLGDGVQNIILPIGEQDCLGVMTGIANVDIVGADMTLLPGAFGDHLTSWAGDFDNASQTKMSAWIAKGASGSCGTVEEPCNFPGKFPHPRLHVYYAKGLSLGEATLRSLGFVPFQALMYGDPLTRTFAHLPEVTVNDLPTEPLTGTITLTPQATTTHPTAGIDRFELLIGGILHSSVQPGAPFTVDTTSLPDGRVEFRVIAFEDSAVASQGEWSAEVQVRNHNRDVTLITDAATGDLGSVFTFSVAATGAGPAPVEIRLIQNHRVLAAVQDANSAGFAVAAATLGAGVSKVIAVAEFPGGERARSEAVTLDIAFATPPNPVAPGNSAPVAYNHTVTAAPVIARLVDLPALDADGDPLEIINVSQPTQSALDSAANAFLLRPDPTATGTDSFTFQATDGTLTSNVATVTIEYCTVVEIVTQPASRQACIGETIQFEVAATGSTLSYQWFRGGSILPGETDATLTIENAQASAAGSYSVEVTDTCGDIRTTETSTSATLSVDATPIFQMPPVGTSVCIGGSWFAIVSAPGSDSFQWYQDGTPVPGATSSFLFLTEVTPADSGMYTAEAINNCGSVISPPTQFLVLGCGDGDGDGDNDMGDFALFQLCFTGPQKSELSFECAHFDFDGDRDVDVIDYDGFFSIAAGPK